MRIAVDLSLSSAAFQTSSHMVRSTSVGNQLESGGRDMGLDIRLSGIYKVWIDRNGDGTPTVYRGYGVRSTRDEK